MTGPDASILIPTYCRPHYLREALVSALAQTHANVQVLVGDDGTFARAVIAQLADPRVDLLDHRERLGMAGNWNALLDAACAPVLCLLMDDDRLLPTFVERCLAVLNADPATGVAFTNHLWDDGGVHRVRTCAVSPGQNDNFATTFLRDSPVAVSAAAVRRDLWRLVRPLPNTAAADMVLFGKLADMGTRFHYIDEPLMIYRVHGSNLSADPSFRTDTVAAWRALGFSDPVAERLRATKEARALESRAALRIQRGELRDARADLTAARALPADQDVRRLFLAAVAMCPPLARTAATAHSVRGQLRRLMLRSLMSEPSGGRENQD
jgi:glycosyltransferase involved in cell wall biosynthesis